MFKEQNWLEGWDTQIRNPSRLLKRDFTMVAPREIDDFDAQPSEELNKNGMTVDLIHIREGEDIREKIMQHLKEAEKNHPSFRGHALSVTILTAVGTVRNFTLHAHGSDKYYEGEYSLTSLKGEFFIQKDGKVEQLNNLKIQLSGPEYKIFGGEVLGSLISASPTPVVVGYIFIA